MDDGAAVGKQGEGVGAATEAEEQIVASKVFNLGVRREAATEGGEIDGAMVFVDLDGVAATESNVSAALSGEVGEDALAADETTRARGAGYNLGAL